MTKSKGSNKTIYLKYMNLLKLEHRELPTLGVVSNKLGIPKNTLSRYFKEDSELKYEVFQHVYNKGLKDVTTSNIKQKENSLVYLKTMTKSIEFSLLNICCQNVTLFQKS